MTARVRYGNLSRHARDVIRWWCDCPDDRCIGFHHDRPGDCHCLEATLGSPHGPDFATDSVVTKAAPPGGSSPDRALIPTNVEGLTAVC